MIRSVIPMLVVLWQCSCASLPEARVSARLTTGQELLHRSPSFQEFLKLGPFNYQVKESYLIRVRPEVLLNTDLFVAKSSSPSPLVIIQHGNKADKRVHRLQAEHLASWGFHVITVEQPNQRQWIANGHRLADLVNLLLRWPKIFPSQFLREQIILAGHSFGGSAVAIAGSQSAVAGVIFLDPALYSEDVQRYLKRLDKPTMLLAADRRVFYSKQRNKFFRLTAGRATQVALRHATHEDAQYPSLTEVTYFVDPFTDDKNQTYFMAALTASAFSMAKQGNFNFAWSIMKNYRTREKAPFFGFRKRGTPNFKRQG